MTTSLASSSAAVCETGDGKTGPAEAGAGTGLAFFGIGLGAGGMGIGPGNVGPVFGGAAGIVTSPAGAPTAPAGGESARANFTIAVRISGGRSVGRNGITRYDGAICTTACSA